uniref:Uncharacterized protein n=1 Tax=Arundo donax TaxID=35708 RepID=A0A0A9FK08_ARUDO
MLSPTEQIKQEQNTYANTEIVTQSYFSVSLKTKNSVCPDSQREYFIPFNARLRNRTAMQQ